MKERSSSAGKPAHPPKKGGSSARVAPGILALSTAAVLVVYGAGFMRTRAAADRLTQASGRRHPVDMAEVQQVLDVARFTSVSPPSAVSAPPQPPVAATPAGDATAAPAIAAAPTRAVSAPSGATGGEATPKGARPAASTPAAATVASGGSGAAPAAGVTTTPNAASPGSGESAPPEALPVAAAPSVAAPEQPSVSAVEAPKYHDGRYTGWGYCRHGEIQAAIVVEGGRIVSAEITQCMTRYSCDWIAKLPPQVVSRQSAEVDFVSGATESADAFYYAIEDALKKAK